MEPLTVPGMLESLADIAEYVKAAAAAAGLDSKATYRLRLAVDEIVTNVVTHGYAEAGLEGTVTVRAEIDPATVQIAIEDSGTAYDPRQAKAPEDLDVPLEAREEGGLGMYLVLQNVDGLGYQRVKDRNRTVLTMNRAARPAAGAE